MLQSEISFNTMPQALMYLIGEMETVKQLLQAKDERKIPIDRWMNIDELCEYLPDRPARQTVYGWIGKRVIPYHKDGRKKLRFLKSEIDNWLSSGKVKCEADLVNEASDYLEKRKEGKRYE